MLKIFKKKEKKRNYITKFIILNGDSLPDLCKNISIFLAENSDLDDFEIVDIQYGKIEKYIKGTDPRIAYIIYRHR